MATDIEQSSVLELHNDKTSTSSSIPSTSGPKVSIFAAKSGFVIPKNKLSGSLVPIFRGSKKLSSNDSVSQESNSEHQRKTKWGPDLTQDAAVKKGRVLAYQTRVDQIAQQLKQGILELGDHKGREVSDEHAGLKTSIPQNEAKTLETLELEKQEIIGEILELNPSYKAPPDYKPSLKEAVVVIPVKDHPEYNFVGLICGPGNETLKRLGKETGAKLRLQGIKAGSGEKVEISAASANETLTTYDELTVLVSADTFDKVDSAVSVVELLVSSRSGNLVAGDAAADNQYTKTPLSAAPDAGNQEATQLAEPGASQGGFPQESWYTGAPPLGPSYPSSSVISSQFLSAPMPSNPGDAHLPFFNTSTLPSHLGPPSTPSSMFTSNPVQPFPTRYPSPNPYPPRNFPMQGSQPFPMQNNSSAPPPYNSNQRPPIGLHPSTMSSQPQPPPIVPQVPRGDNPLASDRSSSVWSGASASQTAPSMVLSQGQMISRPGFASHVPYPNISGPNLGFPGNVQPRQPTLQLPSSGQMSHHSATPSSFPGQSTQPFARPSRPNFPNVQPMSAAARPNEHSGIMPGTGPNFFPMRQPPAEVRPQHPVRGDFTFQPHHPQNPHNQAVQQLGGAHPSSMNTLTNRPMLSPAAQAPSFPPMRPSSNLHPGSHEFPRPQMGQPRLDYPFGRNPAGASIPPRFAAFPDGNPGNVRTQGPQMMSRNMGPPMSGSQLQHQPGYPMQMNMPREFRDSIQQPRPNFAFASSRPGGNLGRQQVYDPFSPSASQQPGMGRKADNDPEYEDLMASMGLK
ncbi:Branchpoint-bridging protein [Linum perenne]